MSQREAGLGTLDWRQTSAGSWAADLPAIPGYPTPGGGHYHVELYGIVNDDHEIIGYGFSLNIVGPTGAVTLWDDEFGFGYADSEEEAKQEVESLSPGMIAQAAADHGVLPWGDGVVSRKGKHMIRKATKRTASLGFDWERTGNGEWAKYLPAIPGYPATQTEGNAQVVVQPTGDGFGFDIFITNSYDLPAAGVDYIHLDNLDFDIPDTDTAEEMMAAVDNLSLRDIANMLDDMGYGPIDNPTAARHAAKRTARLDLNWEPGDPGKDWKALLPDIPGYANENFYNEVTVYRPYRYVDDEWVFTMSFILDSDATASLTNEDFGIYGTVTAEQLMNEVENLTVADIADVLMANGYMPDED